MSEVESVSGYVGNYQVRIRRKPRYIDEGTCTGCGNCAEACPVETVNPFDLGLSTRKAAYRFSAQSVPGAYAIEKKGIAPCREACPTDQRAQGYIALVRQKRFADAYHAIRREHPFPSVCGRVCNHRCEEACTRGQVDEPVNIMALKRFVADWAYTHRDELPRTSHKALVGTPFQHHPAPSGKRVAVIGAGPAGLTAALDLVRLGHAVTVLDALPKAGGMMRVGIPPHRLPQELLDWEIQQIVEEGVVLRLNTRVADVPGLLKEGYDAVLMATGAHAARKLPIPNADHPDNLLSLDVLRKACLGETVTVKGSQVAVLGGGNVALDTARTILRLGAAGVSMICLEPRGEMPGFAWEVTVAEQEGIRLYPGRTFKEILVEGGHITGVRCAEIEFRGFKGGKPDFKEIPGSEHSLAADRVVWAIGQGPDLSFLPQDGSIQTRSPGGVKSNKEMQTTLPGVFTAGDVHRGVTFFVVDAIGEGHHAARAIDRHLRGQGGIPEPKRLPAVNLSREEIHDKFETGKPTRSGRVAIRSIPLEARRDNFREVDLTFCEGEALQEAGRCLGCGICSECLECLSACERGAIDHDMTAGTVAVTAGAIILATGFRDFDPRRAPELGFGKYENVLTAMQFERLVNPSGPTEGKVLLKNGKAPKSVAVLHCVGSRDERYNAYCSRACCMYSLKLSQLAREYLGAEVYDIYRDMRTFGKGYEEFLDRTREAGVHIYHGTVKEVSRHGSSLRVSWEDAFYDQPDHADVDLVILATGMEPQPDAGMVAARFGINLSGDGFFRERHPKLAPVETVNEGIYIAGTCQSPKDIPDSVVQAGGAAAAALALIDQGTIRLDPVVAQVDTELCIGCGQCASACPYGAIQVGTDETETREHAIVDIYVCKGCGTCAGACLNKAVTLTGYSDRELIAEMVGALGG